jgi:aspartyl-tRNA(Asn)/glutamyl-tRNA(Gln) amidotransferase subunit C
LAIDSAEVRRIAALANLELDAETIEIFRDQLQSILDYVAMLDELDVSSIPPTAYSVERRQPLREDEAQPSLRIEQALENAPGAAAGHFRVPRVLDA